jgi:hypothetical protein
MLPRQNAKAMLTRRSVFAVDGLVVAEFRKCVARYRGDYEVVSFTLRRLCSTHLPRKFARYRTRGSSSPSSCGDIARNPRGSIPTFIYLTAALVHDVNMLYIKSCPKREAFMSSIALTSILLASTPFTQGS